MEIQTAEQEQTTHLGIVYTTYVSLVGGFEHFFSTYWE